VRRALDRLLVIGTGACALVALGIVVGIVVAIAWRGASSVSWSFLTEPMRAAGSSGGIVYHILGTGILLVTALAVSAPTATAIALVHGVYLRSERAKDRLWLALAVANGIPSILFGLFGLIFFVRFLGMGKSWLTGGFLLGVMMLPTVSVALAERIRALPSSYVEAAAGLGLSPSRVVRSVILPQCRGGLVTGSLLGLARATPLAAKVRTSLLLVIGQIGLGALVIRLEVPLWSAVAHQAPGVSRYRLTGEGASGGRMMTVEFRVGADGRTERLYAQDEGHFTSVQLEDDGTIWAGDGKEGRVHRIGPDGAHAVWIDVEERQVLHIDMLGNDRLFVTGDAGAIYRVVPGRAQSGPWTSKVLDAKFPSRFGQLTWRGDGAVQFQTRSGNVEEPDDSWSAWSAPVGSPGPIRSAAARFLQIRARFPAAGDARVYSVTAYYLPQNQRPRVSNVRIKEDESSKNKNKNRGDGPPDPSTEYELTWDVANPDDDRIRYRLRFREEGQQVWRSILEETEELTDDEYEWDTSGIPDGWYVVQVVATDEMSNPGGRTLRDTAESEPLLIDNHPPRIEGFQARGTTIVGRAIDGLGPIAKLEYAIDGGDWEMFFPVDDLFDTATERFELDLGTLDAGPHIVAVRATDAGGNTVTAETTVGR